MNIVLDTNAVLYFLGGRLRDPLPQAHLYISVITEIELLSYPLLSSESEAEIYSFLDDVTIVDLSTEIKQETIKYVASIGLNYPMPSLLQRHVI